MPLWAGIASEEQAREIIFNELLNPEEFWSPYPIPALAISEPGYSDRQLMSDLGCSWRANTWIPTNYMVYHGLRDYGYDELASLLALRTKQLIDKAGDREYYTSEDGLGEGLDPATVYEEALAGSIDAELKITNMGPTRFNHSRRFHEFSPAAELRVNMTYQLTRSVSLGAGWTALWISKVARAPGLIEYVLEQDAVMGIGNDNIEDVFIHGVNATITLNRY